MPDDKKKPSDDKSIPVAPVSGPKEQEVVNAPKDVLADIQERSKEADEIAEKQVQEAIGEEARLAHPEPKIPPDVSDRGVESPEKKASEIAAKGGTIELPISASDYERGQQIKVKSKVTKKLEVYGVSSIIALAMYVGRVVKLAHHHAKKWAFRKSSSKSKTNNKSDKN